MRERGSNHQVSIDLSAYATSSPTDDTREVDFKRLSGPLSDLIEAKSGDDFLSKCYAWLKDQSEFSGASDAMSTDKRTVASAHTRASMSLMKKSPKLEVMTEEVLTRMRRLESMIGSAGAIILLLIASMYS